MSLTHAARRALVTLAAGACVTGPAFAQFPAPTPEQRAAMQARAESTAADHRAMMRQLGITALRPGPSGNERDANHANYDEALANPYPRLPNVLQLKNGQAVTTPALWAKRRAEIVEDFEREVYGRIPTTVPKVTWTVAATDTGTVGGRRVIGRQLVGHADNAAYPAITVDIPATLVVPADAKAPVPVMILFRGGSLAQALGGTGSGLGARSSGLGSFQDARAPSPEPRAPTTTEQLVADGWGFVFLDPTAVQADNGAGLTKGIIGLTNKGQPRKPDDWGALRAWGWGASRALDYLETDRAVNAKQVAVEGVSRYGKAALVTMAFDPRFAAVLVGSSGEGGAKLHRRNFGEAVESLTGPGEYHWMAGNFLKYGASQASFGSRTPDDLPVDAHELLALCAPRLTFVSYGVPEQGDAKWLDQQGSFMATVAAQPVFRLLGATALGRSDDYATERMPPVNVGLLDGQLAWRQHDGGHTDAPNVTHFLAWADRWFGRAYTAAVLASGTGTRDAVAGGSPVTASRVPVPGLQQPPPADRPAPRTDANSMLAHQQLLAKKTQGKIDVYYIGDSITRRWGATDYPDFLANWKQNFFGWNAADFGWGADRIENILWRVDNGELDGVNPKVIVLLAGTNNLPGPMAPDAKVADITRGLQALVQRFRAKAPNATVILTGIFPRKGDSTMARTIVRINENLARMADGKTIRYVNINDKLAGPDGQPYPGLTMDGLHPTVKGYQIWADALKPILTQLLGPPKATDHAPPPTGDPSAKTPPSGAPNAQAPTLRLPKLLTDGMVLQRNAPIPVWGWAPPRAAVTVAFRGQTQRATADDAGRWTVRFPATAAGGPYTIDVTAGTQHVTLRDVLVGDVWVASGQSNMEWPVAQVTDAKAVVAAAHDSALRQFKVPISWAERPEDDVAGGDWQPADPQHVGNFSGVAYFFAKELREHERIPIGIINTSWGGANIETWLSAEAQHMGPDSAGRLLHAEQARLTTLRDSIQATIGAVPEHDPGLVGGRAVWADPALDDAAWKPITVPGYWEGQGFANVDGIGWYRTTFTLTADEARQPVTLSLGPIDDDDVTFVNGVEVGHTSGYAVPRTYTVPASALHEGANVLAVRVADYSGGGGIAGGAAPTLVVGGTPRSIAGTWKFRLGELSVRMDAQRTNKIPAITYNKMVHPLLPYPIAGVIWYQGESNANNDAQARAYRGQFASMITSWRAAWQPSGSARDFPFLWVQLPNYTQPDSVPSASGGGWALQREAMDAALSLPKTGRAITIDVGGATLLHPTNKQDPGHRLALVARKVAYGEPVLASGPTYRAHTVRGNSVVVDFGNVGGGLVARARPGVADGTVGGFALAGADHKWVWAQGRIEGNRVVVSDPRVPAPVAVRYAWANNPVDANLYNRDGLPAAPFRTDKW